MEVDPHTALSLKCQQSCFPDASINPEMSTRAEKEWQCHSGGGGHFLPVSWKIQ